MAKKPGKANFKNAIREHGGVISEIAKHFEVSRKTVYNWRDHYGVVDEIRSARTAMRDVAEDVIYQVLITDPVADDDKAKARQIDVAKFTLSNTSKNGEFITLSDDVMSMMRMIGLTVESVSQIFEAMVREKFKQEQKQLVA